MSLINRVLYPIDFSPRCHGTAAYVEALVGRFDAELILLHVVEPPTYNSLLAEPKAIGPKAFDDFFGPDIRFLRVERLVEHGEPARKIVECAASRQVDLIMLPTQGMGIFRRLLLGSTAAKVLHDADCPVWTGVHMESAPQLDSVPLRRIVCAVDLKESSARVLTWAHRIAEEYQAELTLVHARPASERSKAGEALDRLQASVGTQAAVRIVEGEPADVVAGLAKELHADLLVIGRRGLAGFLGRLEMTAYSIIRQSPCPVVSV